MAAFKPQPVPDPLPEPGGNKVSFEAMTAEVPYGKPPGKFKQFYQNNKWYFWAIILGIVIIGVLAFFAFHHSTPEPTKNADVAVTITASDTTPAGGEMIYKIQIDNHDKSKLEKMSLELVYDDGIKYVSSVPPADNISGSRFPVPDLGPGENAVIIVKTTASGDINQEKRLVAKLHYKFADFNSEFTQEAVHTVRLIAADIVLDVTGPETATNVQNSNYDIYYRNDSDKSISGARIQVTYPSEFKFAGSTPSASLGQNVWNLNNLDRNASGKISFSGNFKNARAGQAVVFKVEFLALDDQDTYFTQSSTTYMTTIESQPLSAEIRLVNDVPNGVIKPGDSVQYEVKYQNNTKVVATGINVVVEVDSKAIDPATIKVESGYIEGSTITWNGSSISQLEQLNPNESGVVRFSAQVRNPAAKDGSKNIQVVTRAKMKSNENPTFLAGNELALKVSSPSSIERGVTSVSGPIPPVVGQITTMQVSIALRNATNDYREGVLVGYVPLGVTFDKASVSAAEAAAVKFDSATGKLTWTVGQLAANSGTTTPLRTLKFNVKVTPTSNQVNQSISLFKTITFTAKDTFTDQNISINSQEATTDDLPGDGSDGRVQAQ